jgi:glycerol-3-phosphate acyltransferase PlsY
MILPLLIAAVVGYVLGALPFGYLVARAKGINIFEHGSKNPGATNVKRVLGEKFGRAGKRLGNLVFVLDAVKGSVATGWPLWLLAASADSASVSTPLWAAIVGLVAALLGHSFSCFTKFKGGKGVATAAGGFLVLMPVAIAISLALWVVTFYATRYVSLASILAALCLPVAAYFVHVPTVLLVFAAIIAAFVVIRHRANISRLMNGTENRFTKKPAGPQV